MPFVVMPTKCNIVLMNAENHIDFWNKKVFM